MAQCSWRCRLSSPTPRSIVWYLRGRCCSIWPPASRSCHKAAVPGAAPRPSLSAAASFLASKAPTGWHCLSPMAARALLRSEPTSSCLRRHRFHLSQQTQSTKTRLAWLPVAAPLHRSRWTFSTSCTGRMQTSRQPAAVKAHSPTLLPPIWSPCVWGWYSLAAASSAQRQCCSICFVARQPIRGTQEEGAEAEPLTSILCRRIYHLLKAVFMASCGCQRGASAHLTEALSASTCGGYPRQLPQYRATPGSYAPPEAPRLLSCRPIALFFTASFPIAPIQQTTQTEMQIWHGV
mmetsp:Transcript_10105/g.29037  ORF Transcript_10105/g.29037 Transcript_10105/m.29037 type:complete len:292 (-) Transcript_10105:436-1311(-)